MRSFRFLLVAALLAFARPAAAQSIVGQDSTLAGLKRVYVKFDIPDGSLDARASAAMQDALVLELRKVGIKVAKTAEELDPAQDGVMLVQFSRIARAMSNDAVFRLDVRQSARLTRTGRPSFMVTWFHEANGRNVDVTAFASTAAKQGTDEFISKWLDVNGR